MAIKEQQNNKTIKQRNNETICFSVFSLFSYFNRVKRGGFTLIEIIVVMSIITLISSLTLYNFRAGNNESRIAGAAQKFALNIRKAQNMAASSVVFKGQIPAGYGIYVSARNAASYVLFADFNDNKRYDSAEKYEIINLEPPILISGIISNPGGAVFPLNIVFTAPEPKVKINNNEIFNAITIRFGAGRETKTVYVNNFGYVSVQ